MNIKKLILLFLCLGAIVPLVAMEEEAMKKQARLNSEVVHAAALTGDLDEVKRLVEQGAQMNTALNAAAYNGHSDICKFLIEKGADVMDVFGITNALERSVSSGDSDTVLAVLVTLSPIEREKIVKDKDAFIACQLSMVRTKIVFKDIRKLITQCFVNDLVDHQMERIKGFIEAKGKTGQNMRDLAKKQGKKEIFDLLDLENPKSYERIRRLVWSNVMRVLFGEPSRVKLQEKTTELSEDEAFGSWF